MSRAVTDWTTEQRKAQGEERRHWWNGLPQERKDAINIQRRASCKRRRAEMTKEDHQHHNTNVSTGLKKSWAEIPEDQRHRGDEKTRELRSGNMKQIHLERGPEEKAEIVRKIRESHKRFMENRTEEQVQAAVKRMKAANQAMWDSMTPERAKVRAEKIQNTILQQIADGTRDSYYATGIFRSQKCDLDLVYESSYELVAFRMLEQMSKVIRFERCPFVIPYVDIDGSQHLYFPDILITYTDGSQEVIEVKPKCFLVDETVQAKATAAIEFCLSKGIAYTFWSEDALNLLGVN